MMKKQIIGITILVTSYLNINAQMVNTYEENTYSVSAFAQNGLINDLERKITQITLSAPIECSSFNLDSIRVNDCEISKISSNTFLNYKNLKEVIFQRCTIKIIEELSLQPLTRLIFKKCILFVSSAPNISLRENIDFEDCFFERDVDQIKN